MATKTIRINNIPGDVEVLQRNRQMDKKERAQGVMATSVIGVMGQLHFTALSPPGPRSHLGEHSTRPVPVVKSL